MSWTSPNLDDRTFEDLVAAAVARVRDTHPEWTDLSPGDPGVVLLEAFAFLTETLLYRLNRVPEKVHVELLRLTGVVPLPPVAAAVRLELARARGEGGRVVVPAGTPVGTAPGGGGDALPVFRTVRAVELTGDAPVEVHAVHAKALEGVLLGHTRGVAGQVLALPEAPVIADHGLLAWTFELGVEIRAGEELPPDVVARQRRLEVGGEERRFLVWDEVPAHAARDPEGATAAERGFAYRLDRVQGRVLLPGVGLVGPRGEERREALGVVPPAGREVRAWYRSGGGAAGNLPAGALTTLPEGPAGVDVRQPAAAAGGRDAETLAEAALRAGASLRSGDRAVTREDYERLARQASGAVGRARAATLRSVFAHAPEGTVEVVLVPAATDAQRASGRLTRADLEGAHDPDALAEVRRTLDVRRPCAVRCDVRWARYKPVSLSARLVVREGTDEARLRESLLRRLDRTLAPVPLGGGHAGWAFERPLRAYVFYELLRDEPAVLWAEGVSFRAEEPSRRPITCLAADACQPRTLYAGRPGALFRSTDDAEGWERVLELGGETPVRVEAHPSRAGLVAVVTKAPPTAAGGGEVWRVRVTSDCFESGAGEEPWGGDFGRFHDVAWSERDGAPVLWVAAESGLYALQRAGRGAARGGWGEARQVRKELFQAVVATPFGSGEWHVVATARRYGVWHSREGGREGTFVHLEPPGDVDVRPALFQVSGGRTYLWVGLEEEAGRPERGVLRYELRDSAEAAERWHRFDAGWSSGSVKALCLRRDRGADGGERVRLLAGTDEEGVRVLDLSAGDDARWKRAEVRDRVGLASEVTELPKVAFLASARGEGTRVLAALEGDEDGVGLVVEAADGGFEPLSYAGETVTFAHGWLPCSGEHALEITVHAPAGAAGG